MYKDREKQTDTRHRQHRRPVRLGGDVPLSAVQFNAETTVAAEVAVAVDALCSAARTLLNS